MKEPSLDKQLVAPSPSEMGERMGFGSVIEEGEGYILFMDEDGHKQEVLKGWPDPPPKDPPIARIVGIDKIGQESFAQGIMHDTTWPYISTPPATWNEKYPTIPDTPDAIGVNQRTLLFLTNARPSSLDVSGWKEPPIPGKVYTPEEMAAVEIYEYVRSNRSPGERFTSDGHLEYYKIPPEVLSRPYVLVGATWSTPPRVVNDEIVPESYGSPPNARWLFYIADK